MSDAPELVKKLFAGVLEESVIKEILKNSRILEVNEGEVVTRLGQYVREIPIVVKGVIKVLREGNDGNELFLYYLKEGDACASSLTCCLKEKPSEVKAIAEEPSIILKVSLNEMNQWLKKYPSWNTYIFDSVNRRFHEMLHTIDGIAFSNLDKRLINYLIEKKNASGSNIINKTHQEIAYELNSSRVVISRLLKKLEQDGFIKLYRHQIEILDPAA